MTGIEGMLQGPSLELLESLQRTNVIFFIGNNIILLPMIYCYIKDRCNISSIQLFFTNIN